MKRIAATGTVGAVVNGPFLAGFVALPAGSGYDAEEVVPACVYGDASAATAATVAVGFSMPITSVGRNQAGPIERTHFEIDAPS